jgi:cellulose synthase/poly-beta-1,6-N-acetylglucosamine synthase-like glycosyltransferase
MVNNLITIVIPCKNEGKLIVEVIKKIRKKEPKVKIIISDSSDEPLSLSELKKIKNVTIVDGGLPSVARNNGAKLVDTEYILFIDADIYIENDVIKKSLEIMSLNDKDLVTTKFRTNDGKYNWVYKIFDVIQFFTSKTKPFCLGGFMLFKTDKFRELGGFNENYKIAEDYEISSKIHPEKFEILNDYVYTTSRRFKNKGVWYMLKLMMKCWINRNNEEFHKQDFKYWVNGKKN